MDLNPGTGYVPYEGDEPARVKSPLGYAGLTCTTAANRAGSIVAGINGAPICRPTDTKGPSNGSTP